MTQIDDILEQAKSMIPETYTAILAREVLRLRAEVREMEIPLPTAEDWWGMILRRGKGEDRMFQMAHEFGMRDGIKWAQLRGSPEAPA